MIYRLRHSNKGITMIELVVSLGILSIVITAIFGFFNFGNITYSYGINQQDVQSNIRMVSNYVTKQVRYSTDVEIMDITTEPVPAEPNENYIYIDESSTPKLIKHITKYYTKSFDIGGNTELLFSKISHNEINFNIYSEKGKQKYNIQSELLVLNLHMGADGAIIGTTTGNTIKYTTATGFISEQLRPIASLGDVNSETSVEISFDRSILGAEILPTPIDVVNPSITAGTDKVTINTTSASSGAEIAFRVEFAGDATYGATYDYSVIYNGATWDLE